jgi:hypothetical protein
VLVQVLSVLKQLFRGIIFESQSWRSGEFTFSLYAYSMLFVAMTVALVPFAFGIFLVNPSAIRFVHLLPVLGAFFISFGYLRTVAYLPLVVVPIALIKYRLGHFDHISLGRVTEYAALAGVLLIAGNLIYLIYSGNVGSFYGSGNHRFEIGSTPRFTDRMPQYILEHYPDENILVHYNLSGYYIWRWWPYKKVFIDTKGSAYKDEFFAEYGEHRPSKLAEMFGLDYVLVPISLPRNIASLIPSEKWAVVAFDEGTILYERVDSPRGVDPFDVTLVTESDYKNLTPALQRAFRSMITIIDELQNAKKMNTNQSSDQPPAENTGNRRMTDQ